MSNGESKWVAYPNPKTGGIHPNANVWKVKMERRQSTTIKAQQVVVSQNYEQ